MDENHPKPLNPIDTPVLSSALGGREFYCSSCGSPLESSQIGGSCSRCGKPISGSFENSNLPTSGSGIASMVLGIASIVTCILYGIPAVVCGILAIVFAGKAERAILAGEANANSRGMATAGKVCGWIGISLGSIYALVMVGYFILIAVFFTQMVNNPNSPLNQPLPQNQQNVAPNSQLSPTPGAPTIDDPEESSDDTPDPNPDALPIEPESESRSAP